VPGTQSLRSLNSPKAHPSLLLFLLISILPKQNSLVRPLLIPGIFTPVPFIPAVGAVEFAVAADAAQCGVVVADGAPC